MFKQLLGKTRYGIEKQKMEKIVMINLKSVAFPRGLEVDTPGDATVNKFIMT